MHLLVRVTTKSPEDSQTLVSKLACLAHSFMTPVMTPLSLLSGSACITTKLGTWMVCVGGWLWVPSCASLLPVQLRLHLEPKGERKLFLFIFRLSWLLLRALFLVEMFWLEG